MEKLVEVEAIYLCCKSHEIPNNKWKAEMVGKLYFSV